MSGYESAKLQVVRTGLASKWSGAGAEASFRAEGAAEGVGLLRPGAQREGPRDAVLRDQGPGGGGRSGLNGVVRWCHAFDCLCRESTETGWPLVYPVVFLLFGQMFCSSHHALLWPDLHSQKRAGAKGFGLFSL